MTRRRQFPVLILWWPRPAQWGLGAGSCCSWCHMPWLDLGPFTFYWIGWRRRPRRVPFCPF